MFFLEEESQWCINEYCISERIVNAADHSFCSGRVAGLIESLIDKSFSLPLSDSSFNTIKDVHVT